MNIKTYLSTDCQSPPPTGGFALAGADYTDK